LLASESLKARMGGTCQGGAPYGRTTLTGGETIRAKLEEKQAKKDKLIHFIFWGALAPLLLFPF